MFQPVFHHQDLLQNFRFHRLFRRQAHRQLLTIVKRHQHWIFHPILETVPMVLQQLE